MIVTEAPVIAPSMVTSPVAVASPSWTVWLVATVTPIAPSVPVVAVAVITPPCSRVEAGAGDRHRSGIARADGVGVDLARAGHVHRAGDGEGLAAVRRQGPTGQGEVAGRGDAQVAGRRRQRADGEEGGVGVVDVEVATAGQVRVQRLAGLGVEGDAVVAQGRLLGDHVERGPRRKGDVGPLVQHRGDGQVFPWP